MSSFQGFGAFSYHNNPYGRGPKELLTVGVEQALSLSCNSTQKEPVLRRMRVTPLGFCLRVIVKKNPKSWKEDILCSNYFFKF